MHETLGMVAIVEDDEAMCKSIERLLQAHRYATAAFESAEDFLQSSVCNIAAGLIADIHLGGMSGIELCRRLRARGSKIPVVFMTARDSEAARAAAIAVGCIDFLRKPFEPSQLVQSLERGIRS
jgi:FixJ family two-component response regulator